MSITSLLSPFSALQKIIKIDPRALAAFRIGFGFVLLFDFLTKSAGLTAFYTDQGILPRALAIDNLGWWSFSFHMANGSFWFQCLLMVIGCTFAVCLILGYQTRLMTFLLWLFVLSLQNRNYLILHSGDALIRLLLFWSMFLPLEIRWSLDLRKSQTRLDKVPLLPSAAILLQMFSIYFFTAILKDHAEWNRDFTALYYVMNLEQYTTAFGQLFLQAPELMKMLTASTYYLELVGPLLLLVPYKSNILRTWIPLAFIGFHLGLVATMNLGLFPWVCIVGWIVFLPAGFWDRFEPLRKKLESGFRIPSISDQILAHLPEPYRGHAPFWWKWAAGTILVYSIGATLTWNIMTLPKFNTGVPNWIRTLALPLRLDQYWCMFAPYPMRADGWFVVDGTLNDDSSADTWNGNFPVSWDKPENLFIGFRSTQWRKYLGNVWIENHSTDLQLAFGKYVCREWNRLGEKRPPEKLLKKFELYYMRENTPPPGEIPIVKENFLWRHECFANVDKNPPATPPAIKN